MPGPGYADVVLSDPSLKDKFILFRGKPLVRANNLMCYGDMNDKYVVFLMILATKKLEQPDPKNAPEVPETVMVQIWDTDTKKPAHERVVKQFEKKGLYEALDIGIIWMNKLNAE